MHWEITEDELHVSMCAQSLICGPWFHQTSDAAGPRRNITPRRNVPGIQHERMSATLSYLKTEGVRLSVMLFFMHCYDSSDICPYIRGLSLSAFKVTCAAGLSGSLKLF